MGGVTKQGFTIIELIVIIIAVGILSTVAILSIGRFQDQSNDAKRSANITIITEALEKYYDKTGWYPNCQTMTSAALTVSSVLSVEESILQAPRDTAENSFVCSELDAGDESDKFAYVGDGSSDCASGDGCTTWTIQYRNDENGLVYSVVSQN